MGEGLDPNKLFEGVENNEGSKPLDEKEFELSKDEKLKRAAADARRRAELKTGAGDSEGKGIETYKPPQIPEASVALEIKDTSPFKSHLEKLAKIQADIISLNAKKGSEAVTKNPAEKIRINEAEKALAKSKKEHLQEGFVTAISDLIKGDAELNAYLSQTGETIEKQINEKLKSEGKPPMEKQEHDEIVIKHLADVLAGEKSEKMEKLFSGPLSTLSAYENTFKISKAEIWEKARGVNQRVTGKYGQKNIPGENKPQVKQVPADFTQKWAEKMTKDKEAEDAKKKRGLVGRIKGIFGR